MGGVGALSFLTLWQFLAVINAVPFLPSFTDSILGLIHVMLFEDLGFHIVNSVIRILLGFGGALLIGIPLGLVIGRWSVVNHFSKPVIQAVRFIPPLAMLPLALVVLGSPEGTAIFIIWFAVLFPVLIGTETGVHRTELVHVDVARSFGADEWQILEKVTLPSALPEILAGARVGLGVGWMSLVAAEMVAAGGGSGLGYLIINLYSVGKYSMMVGVILVLALIGFLMNEGFSFFERYTLRYRHFITQ
jgi:NitT/TauT family transport system permease protein